MGRTWSKGRWRSTTRRAPVSTRRGVHASRSADAAAPSPSRSVTGPTARSDFRRPRPPWRRSRRSSLGFGRGLLLTRFGEEDPIVGRVRGRAGARRCRQSARPARREPLPHSFWRTRRLRFTHLGTDRTARLAVGLALGLGFLLGAAEVFAAPPVEPVIAVLHARCPAVDRRGFEIRTPL